jgi:excisionase family DNA binding protein
MTLNQDASELLSMEEAIERLKTTRPTFYRWLRSGRIKGMKVGRQWRFYPEDIERFLNGDGPRVDLPLDISPLISQLLRALKTESDLFSDLEGAELAAKIILYLAIQQEATHIHLESLYHPLGDTRTILRLRFEAGLKQVAECDRRLLPALIHQFKILAGCDPHSQDTAQEGQFNFDYEQEALRFRAHFLPSLLGESMTLTMIKPNQMISLERLRLKDSVHSELIKALKKGWGMVITSGPTGSGKTTTLYAALQEVASPQLKTISVEEPVEQVFPWVVSVQADTSNGDSLASKLRSAMSTDPDVIMIGELRDTESVEMALRMSLTGHLVLTQLHTESAVHGLLRLIEISGSAYTVCESVRVILNQRLVRKICPQCAEHKALTADDCLRFNPLFTLAQKTCELGQLVPQAKGCQACQHTGYRGRMLISEALSMSPLLSKLLHQGARAEVISEALRQSGWQSLLDDGFERVQKAETTLEELARVAGVF